jgi:hypothetical protein
MTSILSKIKNLWLKAAFQMGQRGYFWPFFLSKLKLILLGMFERIFFHQVQKLFVVEIDAKL